MTRTLFALAAGLAALALPVRAQEAPDQAHEHEEEAHSRVYHQPDQVDPEASRGRMTFDHTFHDFGHIVDTAPVTAQFPFRNAGPGDLVILAVNSTCGCTVPELAKTIYKPGEEGSITVTFNPQNRRGEQVKRITVQTNDPEQATYVLQIKSQVEQLVAFEPAVLAFGNLRKGEIQSRVISVLGRTPDFDVTDVALVGSPAFSAVVLGVEDTVLSDGASGRRVEIEVTADGTAKPGLMQAAITVTTTDARRRTATSNITGLVLGDLSLDTERLLIGPLQPEKSFERVVRLENRLGKPFAFLGAELKSPIGDNKVAWDLLPPEGDSPSAYAIRVIVTAGNTPGALRGTLLLKTDVPDEEQLELPFMGSVRAPAR